MVLVLHRAGVRNCQEFVPKRPTCSIASRREQASYDSIKYLDTTRPEPKWALTYRSGATSDWMVCFVMIIARRHKLVRRSEFRR